MKQLVLNLTMKLVFRQVLHLGKDGVTECIGEHGFLILVNTVKPPPYQDHLL